MLRTMMEGHYPLAFALLLGLFSTIHCVGMCGSIMCALSFSGPQKPFASTGLVLAYNLGRISVYALLGLAAGFSGKLAGESIDPAVWRQTAALIAAVTLVLVGLYLGGWVSQVRRVDRLGASLWRRMEPLGRRFLPVRNLRGALAVGLVWGFLPCGLVYFALVLALSLGNPLYSGLFMLAFGFGTLPALLASGLVAGFLYRATRHSGVRQLAGALIILMGISGLLLAQSDWVHRIQVPGGTEVLHHHEQS
ncbi:MAG: sulfite exporter TauE/SafE family protein [Pseudomonadota bacterium]